MLTGRARPSWAPAYEPWAIEQENVYAHRKRLWFIIRAIEALRIAQGKLPADLAVLDVGCGTGIMITLPLASIGYRVTGIDIDGDSIEAGCRVNPYPNAAFRRGDAGTLAAAGEQYDVVIASEVLEHLTDPLAFLRTLRGLLTRDGILVLTTPNGYGWFEGEQYLWDHVGLGDRILHWNEHWGRFTQRLKTPIKRLIGWQPASPPPPPPWVCLASTQNTASPHVHRFRWTGVERLVTAAGFTITRAGNSSPVCGKISHFYLRNRRAFISLNAWIGDFLPRWAVAGWYLVCHPAVSGKRVLGVADSGLMAQAAAQIEGCFGATPTLLISFRQLRQQPGLAFCLPWRRFDIAAAVLTDIESPLYRDFILAYLFVLRAKRKALCDIKGGELPVGTREGFRALLHCLADLVGLPLIYGYARWKARRLSRSRRTPRPRRPLQRQVAYLRANLWQESRAGGSVAHTGGVLAGLAALGMKVTYVGTTRFPPAQRLGLETRVVPSQQLGWLRNLPDLSFLVYSEIFGRRSRDFLAARAPDFVYQRYSVLNCSGADVADRLRCPLVLEYNGSEVWVARNWSTPMMFEGLAAGIERANLRRADLVVVVSQPLRDEVVAQGVPSTRVLINPNAVDPKSYHPTVDGGPVRTRLGLEGKLIIGFIGTFGPWHGAEVLAQTVRPVASRLPRAHFLFVGDGSGMARVREILAVDGVGERVTLAGLVPQEEGPGYLAACDILVSPHVPNPDGSRFFGSPTKLFEYMAMGKGIVASDLEQIGEILSHGKTAWLVTPGDPGELTEAILALAQDAELRRALGAAARAEVVECHTWKAHVERILRKMVELDLLDSSVLDPSLPGKG
jgi:glycosyltransferase involved in cell wall biosynthesis/2-polyprenyl-3-methyl-5-hydroxy-6-metoxy-1,4-benzoquinol methylase